MLFRSQYSCAATAISCGKAKYTIVHTAAATCLAYKTLICDFVKNYSAIKVQVQFLLMIKYRELGLGMSNNNLSQNTVSIAAGHHDAFYMFCEMFDRYIFNNYDLSFIII